MAIITEPDNIENALDQGVIGTSWTEITAESGEPGAMQSRSMGAKRLSDRSTIRYPLSLRGDDSEAQLLNERLLYSLCQVEF